MEIGSEFWIEKDVNTVAENVFCDTTAVLLSGRSALDFVCRDSKINSITIPSYCCDTMIEPFLSNGVKVYFYRVDIDEITYSDDFIGDAVLVIDYFGYKNTKMEALAQKAKATGKVVIYDSTHNLSVDKSIEQYASYTILSYRKWMYCNFAIVKKHGSSFTIPMPSKTNDVYISLRDKAAQLKADYIFNDVGDKQEYLSLFGKANSILQDNYVDCVGKHIDFHERSIIAKRRENAKILLDEISKIDGVRLWFSKLSENDTPLFVPILAKDADERKCLREHLVAKEIYCPIHWPKSEFASHASSSLYERELSLVCDQRYGKEEMLRQISVISEFYNQ